MIATLLEYYRIPVELLEGVTLNDEPPDSTPGFFQFGQENICFGRCRSGVAPSVAESSAFDSSKSIRVEGTSIHLPFNLSEIIENLRLERYRAEINSKPLERFAATEAIRKTYYSIRDYLPFPIRRQIQRTYFRDWRRHAFPHWPVDTTVEKLQEEVLRLTMKVAGVKDLPFIWYWPKGASNCLVLTHDVETQAGRDFTPELMDLDESYGFKAAYQVIPEQRYKVTEEYVAAIRSRGCEFNIHDLNHDGYLYTEREEFERRAAKINGYLRRYNSKGFRAGAMYRKQDWYDVFEFAYDMSVPNVAHLEPIRGGCCTVMPYFIGKILEIPLTTAQDYSLFHILGDYSIELWKQQISLIKERNGLISFLTHPDYLLEPRARRVYETLLLELRNRIAAENIWTALPGDVDRWWRARKRMRLVARGGGWGIEGPESERARLAHIVLEGERLECRLA